MIFEKHYKFVLVPGFIVLVLFISFLFFFVAEQENLMEKTEDIVFSKEKISVGGFSGSYINAITQDKDGFLWVGTWDGLFMYNGYEVRRYKSLPNTKNCFKGRKVRCLYVDHKGTLWVGTMNGGIHWFDKNKQCFVQYKHPKAQIEHDDIMGIWEDTRHNLWMANTKGQLHKLSFQKENPTFKTYTYPDRSVNFLSFTVTAQDIAWLGTNYGLLRLDMKNPQQLFEKGKYQHFLLNAHDPTVTAHNIVTSILKKGEILWLGTEAGVKKINYKKKSLHIKHLMYNASQGIMNKDKIRVLYQTKYDEKHFWVGSNEGLYRINHRTEKIINELPEEAKLLKTERVVSLFEDASGVLWVGTNQGIEKIDQYKKKFRHVNTLTQEEGIHSDVRAVVQDKTKKITWVGTHGRGLQGFFFGKDERVKKIVSYEFPQESHAVLGYINTLCVDRRGKVWVGTDGEGAFTLDISDITEKKIEKTQIKQYTRALVHKKESLSDKYIYSILADHQNTIWIGTYQGGLNRYNAASDSFIHYNEVRGVNDKLNTSPIIKLFEDSQHRIWIGTRGKGLYVFKPNEPEEAGQEIFKNYQVDSEDGSSLLDNFITDIYEDSQHRIWIGTEIGLCLYNPQKDRFRTFHKFPEEVVQSIQSDENGVLWISTKSGIVKFDVSLLDMPGSEHLVFQRFDMKDGLQNKFFNNSVSMRNKNGVIMFGGLNGVTIFQPEKMKNNPFIPNIVFTDFLLNHQSVAIGLNAQGRVLLRKDINQMKEITLDYQDKILSFEFAALHFAVPEKNKYAYKMEGFDKDWIFKDFDRRYAHYTNLAPGKYTFKVRASNNDGIWNNDGASIQITILPPFWRTSRAYVLYFLVFLGMLYLFRKIVLIRANYRYNIQMERLEREKSEEVHKMELQFFTNISHEIRTPLTLIISPLEKILQNKDINANLYNQLSIMQQQTQRLVRLLNQLMDFRKQGKGGVKLQAGEGDFIKFLREIFISFRGQANDKQVEYIWNTSRETLNVWYDRDMLEKVFYNLLSNAFKYTPAEGKVTVEITSLSSAEVKKEIKRDYVVYEAVYARDYIKIIVNNTGKIIHSENLSNLFERFYRLTDDQHRKIQGAGIGLALSKELVLLHKGIISVNSQEQTGTSFSVYLPLGSTHLDKTEVIENFKNSEYYGHYQHNNTLSPKALTTEPFILPEPEEVEGEKDATGKPLILVVEDNEDVRNFVKNILLPNYKVEEATHGQEGLEKAIEVIPDLVVSDVMMPEMDGIELCSKLKQEEKTSHIPIILLTARTSMIFKVEGIETGADDYITKPFNPSYLMARIKNLIQQRQMLMRRFSDKIYVKPKDITLNPVDGGFLEKVIDIVNENMDNSEYGVEDLGRDVGMSRMQLYRKLKALTGQAANEFMRTQRLQRAAQLLEQGELTIAQVTYEVGFNDLKYFRKRFVKHFGMNPSEYQKNKIENKANEQKDV